VLRACLLRGATLPVAVERFWQVAPALAEAPRKRLLGFAQMPPEFALLRTPLS
jgi:hypothetical protein